MNRRNAEILDSQFKSLESKPPYVTTVTADASPSTITTRNLHQTIIVACLTDGTRQGLVLPRHFAQGAKKHKPCQTTANGLEF